jgi:hypothetical protein
MSYYPAQVIPAILASLLEPESLGQILRAIRYGVEQDNTPRVKILLEGLRQTSRWGINVAMLDAAEEMAGREAWTVCGAKGSFA